jgi:hypothetical protein
MMYTLHQMNHWKPSILYLIKLIFLYVLISNNNGFLSTSVYQKKVGEPCVIPFLSDHPRHAFSNSSILQVFEDE